MSERLFIKGDTIYCEDEQAGELLWDMSLDEVHSLRAELAEAVGLLQTVIWQDYEGYDFCVICDAGKPDHLPDCSLAAFLERNKK